MDSKNPSANSNLSRPDKMQLILFARQNKSELN